MIVDGARHDRDGVHARVGDAPGEDGDVGGGPVLDRRSDEFDLRRGEQRGDVELDPVLGQLAHERRRRQAARRGDRNLDVDVLSPRGDDARLAPHLLGIVGKYLEGYRLAGNALEQTPGEVRVVGQASLPHQRRIGREAGYPRVGREREDSVEVGSVGEDLGGDPIEHRKPA